MDEQTEITIVEYDDRHTVGAVTYDLLIDGISILDQRVSYPLVNRKVANILRTEYDVEDLDIVVVIEKYTTGERAKTSARAWLVGQSRYEQLAG